VALNDGLLEIKCRFVSKTNSFTHSRLIIITFQMNLNSQTDGKGKATCNRFQMPERCIR